MRLADIATVFSVAALGFTSGMLALTLTGSGEIADPAQEIVRGGSANPVPARVRAIESWPTVFGVQIVADAPVEAVLAEPPTKSEVIWRKYTLSGLVALGPKRWAFITSDQGDALVKIGDTLFDGEVVAEIEPEGVWLEKDGARHLVAFTENKSVSIVTLPERDISGDGANPSAPAEVIRVQDLSEDELRALLEKLNNRPSLRRPATQ